MEKGKTYGVWAVRSGASIFGHAAAWCKEDGRPLEFDTEKMAQDYAAEMNRKTTANVHYYAQEKEPEPGAVRKTAAQAQQQLDARAPSQAAPRNEAAEKLNEIPGRQLVAEPDPMVEIRSAVHSNYAGMVAMLGADNRVYLGREERYHFEGDQPAYYDDSNGSLCFVTDRADMYYFLYGEGWTHTQEEMLGRGLVADQYAEFARLQTGNYNMLDGRLDNEPPERPDLTDGQTWEEIRELAPETLPGAAGEKPSLMELLKGERPEHGERGHVPPSPERER